MIEEIENGLNNLGLQDEDVEIADESSDDEDMAAEREARKSLGHMPKYEGRTPWRSFETQFENWRFLNAINDQAVDFQKRALFMALTSGTQLYAAAATYDAWMVALRGIFEPAAESEMSRVEFRLKTQGKSEDISSYLNIKYALYENAYAEGERSFSVLLTSCIEGMHSTVIKRLVQRSNPADQTALRDAAIRAVANERTAYRAGYAESTSLDGLETTMQAVSLASGSGGVEPMEVDGIKGIKCFRCSKEGHRRADCRVPEWKIKKAQKEKEKGDAGRPTRDKSNLKCFRCGKRGHFSRECKGTKKEKGGSSKKVGDEEPDEEDEGF